MQTHPFPINPKLTQIAIAYRNTDLIADSVLPRVQVGSEQFKYTVYAKEDRFTVPETIVGRKGQVNQVEFGSSQLDASVNDYGLEDVIPYSDIMAAGENQDPRGQAVEALSDLIGLAREVRAKNVVFGAGNYGANTQVYAGTDQWTDRANSNPLIQIMDSLESCLMRPNTITLGTDAWKALRMHPEIVKAVLGNSGNSGIVSRQAVAELFEVQNVLVGTGYLNTAAKGQAATLQRVWANHVALTYINPLANTRGGVTFGFTAQWGERFAGSKQDDDIGLRGGEKIKVGESVKELVVASDCGYLMQSVV